MGEPTGKIRLQRSWDSIGIDFDNCSTRHMSVDTARELAHYLLRLVKDMTDGPYSPETELMQVTIRPGEFSETLHRSELPGPLASRVVTMVRRADLIKAIIEARMDSTEPDEMEDLAENLLQSLLANCYTLEALEEEAEFLECDV